MKTLLCILCLCLLNPFCSIGGDWVSPADGGLETLQYFVSKSDLVVVATIVDEPLWIDYSAPISGFYARTCYLQAKIERVLAGDVARFEKIAVQAARIQNTSERPFDDLAKGRKFIFFLKQNKDAWHTADPWFGVCPYTPGLEKALGGRFGPVVQHPVK